jgi:thiosulfate/3-mercaptopyruvate sulfurtransferase
MLTPVSWLVEHFKDPNLVILQVGESYKAGHIPGAQEGDLMRFAAPSPPMNMGAPKPDGPLTLELPTDDQLRTVLETFGISEHSRILIVESENYHSPSTRIFLTLVHAGFGPQTSLLDGGLPAWRAAGQPVTVDVLPVRQSALPPLKTVPVTVDAAYVQAHENTPGTVILDVRAPAAWDGVMPVNPREQPPRFGHIPGSKPLPLEQLWDDATSSLKPAAQLEQAFAAVGVKAGDSIIGYCYVGQRATATLFAAQTLGHPVWLYDGSMEEWARLRLPLEMPAKKGGARR